MPHQHVPGLIKEKIRSSHYARYRSDPVCHAVSGQKMDANYTKKIIDYVKRHDREPMLHVLQIGSNDIWDQPTDETVERVRAFIADVGNKVINSKSSALIITSPIPGDKPEAVAFFEKLHQELKDEVKRAEKNKRVTFADFIGRFTKPDKNGSRYDPKLWEDHRHLNRDGAARFVSSLLDVARTLPAVIFGLRKTKKVKRSAKRQQEARRRDRERVQARGQGGSLQTPRGQDPYHQRRGCPHEDLNQRLASRRNGGAQDLQACHRRRPAPIPDNLLDRPVPAIHRYADDSFLTPVLPTANRWQDNLEKERHMK